MENKRSESDKENGENEMLLNNSISMSRARTLPSPESSSGGVIQPVNPHFSGYNVVYDVGAEDPDVEWVPNPGFVAVVIGNDIATPLSVQEITAINVAPERIASSDDERPASSYSLLDRRHYREDPSSTLDLTLPKPFAIGTLVQEDVEAQDFNVWESLPSVPTSRGTPVVVSKKCNFWALGLCNSLTRLKD